MIWSTWLFHGSLFDIFTPMYWGHVHDFQHVIPDLVGMEDLVLLVGNVEYLTLFHVK